MASVRVAQWIARRTSSEKCRNPEVVGSNPTVDDFLVYIFNSNIFFHFV